MRRLSVFLLVLACALPARAEEDRTLTVVSWGGAYEAAQRAAIFEPFTAETGIEVEVVRYAGDLDDLRAQVGRPDGPDWDVVDMIRSDAQAACRAGLLAPFDPAILAPAPDGTAPEADFIKGAFGGCSVTHLVYATVIAYDDRAFPGVKPDSVADFFDLERFPGDRALRKAPVGMLDWALRSYGVPRSQIYDLLSTKRGLDLAFARLERIRPNLHWWRDGEEPVDMLLRGEVSMATGYNGRFFNAQVMRGAPISVIWDSALLEYDVWAVPKGSPNADLARKFIRFATESEQLAALSNRISYGPARRSAQDRVGLHVDTGIPMRPHMPTADRHFEQALEKDDEWYAQTEDLRWRRFRAWLNGGE